MPEPPLHGTDRVETPERVGLDVDLAGVGSRTLAFLIDWFVLALSTFAATTVMLLVVRIPQFGSAALVVWLVFLFAVWWLYFAVFEGLWDGQTPGKRLLGIRVRKVGGYPPGWPEVLIRNLLRILVDLVAFLIPVGLVLMVLTRRHQRIGDLAAGTVVVRERAAGIDMLDAMGFARTEAGTEVPATDIDLTAREFELLHDFLARRDGFDRASADRIEQRLAAWIRGRLEESSAMTAELRSLPDGQFLARVEAAIRGDGVP